MTLATAGYEISFPQVRLPDCDCPTCGAPTLRSFYADGDRVLLAQCDTCAFVANLAATANPPAAGADASLDAVANPMAVLTDLAATASSGEANLRLRAFDAEPMLARGHYFGIGPTRRGYFTAASFTRLVQRAGLEVLRLTVADGVICIEAGPEPHGGQKRDMPTLTELRLATTFVRLAAQRLRRAD